MQITYKAYICKGKYKTKSALAETTYCRCCSNNGREERWLMKREIKGSLAKWKDILDRE